MQINRDNYEAYLLDLAEGKLSPAMERELARFLEENPVPERGTGIDAAVLQPEEVCFSGKDDMKKGGLADRVTVGNYGQFCIARSEGDLSDEGVEELDRFLIDNPRYAKEAALYDRLKLQPDTAVIYGRKHRLKKIAVAGRPVKTINRTRVIYRTVSVAATIAVLLSGAIFVRQMVRNEGGLPATERRIVSLPAERIRPDATSGSGGNFTAVYPGGELNLGDLRGTPADHEALLSQVLVEKTETTRLATEPAPVFERVTLTPLAGRSSRPDLHTARVTGTSQVKIAAVHSGAPGLNGPEDAGAAGIFRRVSGIIARALDEDSERDRITLWDIADAGVKGINALAGTEMLLEREINTDGELVSMAFSSRIIGFERTVSFNTD